MRYIFSIIFLTFLGLTIKAQNSNAFVNQIEKTIKTKQFHKEEAISFDIDLMFGGKNSLKGTVITATNSSWIKLTKEDGTVIIFDGNKVWITPAAKNNTKARFDIFTWQYFFMAPFKMSDDGAQWKELGLQSYQENIKLPAAQLTFKSGVGDASDDYYIVYKNDKSMIAAMGYIVTFGGKSVSEAEKSAHAIVYDDYQKLNGVDIARKWYFHNWSKTNGIADKIGEATITNLKFVKSESINHTKPESAVEVKL